MNFVRNINKCNNNDIKKDLTILFNPNFETKVGNNVYFLECNFTYCMKRFNTILNINILSIIKNILIKN